jgi:hypothetical protein
MRNFILAAVAAISISLGGCSTLNPNTPLPTAADLTALVQKYTQQACGFLPTVSGVASLIAQFYPAGVPAVSAATAIGEAICAGTTPPTLGRKAASGGTVYKRVQTPRGPVNVPGRFVR